MNHSSKTLIYIYIDIYNIYNIIYICEIYIIYVTFKNQLHFSLFKNLLKTAQ